ncbi:MAG: hypothetical protein MI924_27485 [Chloroflexales bacterium]|nr:hypothetical protein [Chloroflexales bacterium]
MWGATSHRGEEPTAGAAEPTTAPTDDASDEAAASPEAGPEEASDAATAIVTDDASLVVLEETDDTRVKGKHI